MSNTAEPFQKMNGNVSCWVHSPEWKDFRFALTLTTFIFEDRTGCYLTHDRPSGSVLFVALYGLDAAPACDHADCLGQSWCEESGNCSHEYCAKNRACALPWLRIGKHCGHDECYSLLKCRRVRRPLKPVAVGSEGSKGLAPSDTASHSSQVRHAIQEEDVDEDGNDSDKENAISLSPGGVPCGTVESDYDLWMYKDTDSVYLIRLNGEFLLSNEILEGDSPSILMLGPAAKPPCRHDFCRGRSWCQSSGLCDHPGCAREKRCRLPKPRVGPHCAHKKCPSLLQCQGGRPLAKGKSVEPESPRITRSMLSRGSSVDLSASSPPQVPLDDRDPSPLSPEVESEESDQGSSFLDFVPGQSNGSTVGQGSSTLSAAGSVSPDGSLVDSPFDSDNGVCHDADGLDDVTCTVDQPSRLDKPTCNGAELSSIDKSVATSDVRGFGPQPCQHGADEPSRASGKRKAEDGPVDSASSGASRYGDQNGGRMVDTGTRPIAVPVKRRLLSAIHRLSKEHEEGVTMHAEMLLSHHENRQDGEPAVMYHEKSRSPSEMDLDIRIDSLEREIRYCMDLYHTMSESRELSGCSSLKYRPNAWFATEDGARPSKRKAM